ncbi:hypothetical protein L7F22_046642 [Adiantum nelumboides]|nr:hypothetical protein [Adiantum nelumboides]
MEEGVLEEMMAVVVAPTQDHVLPLLQETQMGNLGLRIYYLPPSGIASCLSWLCLVDELVLFKTFKDLLVKELRLRTDENTMYRFLIRSLSSKLPLLQMVVLNYDGLICTGRINADVKETFQCMDPTTGLLNEAGLQQSIKVLFLDCTRFSGDNARPAELWVKEHDAEIVFMLEEFVDRLRDELLANSMFCPPSCGLFQSFTSSFLYTMRG